MIAFICLVWQQHRCTKNFQKNKEQHSRMMNQAIEELLTGREEHYMWNLPLLKTRPDGSKPYRKTS